MIFKYIDCDIRYSSSETMFHTSEKCVICGTQTIDSPSFTLDAVTDIYILHIWRSHFSHLSGDMDVELCNPET